MQPTLPIHKNALPGADDIARVQLPNGVIILTRSNYDSPSVVISGYLNTGGLYDPDEKLGLAYFTSTCLMRGTQQHDFQQLYNALESAGASVGFSSGVHTTSFFGRSLTEDLPMLLSILAEALQTPVFPPQQVERLRTILLTGLAMRAQDTGEMASLAFDRMIYANHPYSRPEDGYTETIRAISRDDLAAFHQNHYGPRGMVISVVGSVSPGTVVDQITQFLGSWQNPAQPEPPTLPEYTPPDEAQRQHISIPGKVQTDLIMGCSGPSRLAPDFIAASLGNNILGQFGAMGRIGDVVREQSGLAYDASASLNASFGPGSWEVSAGVNPANLNKTIELIRIEIERFVHEPVTSEELSDSQAHYIGRLPISLESNGGVAGALVYLERFGLGLDYYRGYAELIRSVTPEMVLQAAQHYLDPTRMAIASAGPG